MTDRDTVSTYSAVAERYRERNADRSGVETLVERFLAAVEDATDGSTARIVDVGCGPGWESATFASRGHETVGIDLTPALLRLAREESPRTSFARMDVRRVGLRSDAFDGLWACASLLHVPREDAPATLSEFHRVVRPGGVVHLSVKRGEGTAGSDVYGEDDERRFTLYRPGELETMVSRAGFCECDVTTGEAGDWVQVTARV